jgi:predicted double-glycine peptidase
MPCSRKQFCWSLCLLLLAVCGMVRAQEDYKPRAPIRDDKHRTRIYVESWKELKQHNIVMQQRDYSCGAAALATVLHEFWGENVNEEKVLLNLVTMLDATQLKERFENGLTLTDLRRVAVKMGYEAAIGTLEYNKLAESKVPLIIGVKVNDYDHFVVYRGTDNYYVYLADPIRGNIRVPGWQFQEQWQKNLVLVVAKAGDVDPPTQSPLDVRGDEIFLGRMNEQLIRSTITRQPRMSIPFYGH